MSKKIFDLIEKFLRYDDFGVNDTFVSAVMFVIKYCYYMTMFMFVSGYFWANSVNSLNPTELAFADWQVKSMIKWVFLTVAYAVVKVFIRYFDIEQLISDATKFIAELIDSLFED